MSNLDYGRLIKLLALTQSDHDGEALSAIRKVNDMLAKAKLSWANILVLRPEPFYSENIFDRAAESVRQARAQAQSYGEELRSKQAARDQKYANVYAKDYADDDPDWWTNRAAAADFPEDVRRSNDEAWALAQTEMMTDEDEKTNWYCFACEEPELAKYLFAEREQSWIARVMFQKICKHGELNDAQTNVLRWRVKHAKGGTQ